MKKVLLVVALVAAAAVAYGALGDIISSFTVPALPVAAGCSGGFFYWASNSGYLYRCAHTTGSIYASFMATPGSNTRGLCYQWGDMLWYGSYGGYAYRIHYSTGSIYTSFAANTACHGISPRCTGDGSSGTDAVFTNNYSTRAVRVYSSMGSLISTFTSAQTMYDTAYDWRNQILWGGMNSTGFYGHNTSGSLVTSFTFAPGSPYGATYINSYLWICGISGTYRIYQVHCPSGVGIAPSSLGRVKAIYK